MNWEGGERGKYEEGRDGERRGGMHEERRWMEKGEGWREERVIQGVCTCQDREEKFLDPAVGSIKEDGAHH